MKLAGQRIVITGASSGIGEALAWELARRGAVCTLVARRQERLEALAARIGAGVPGSITPIAATCDVTDRASVRAALEIAAVAMGGIDVLVNNAGVSVYGATERTGDRDLDEVLGVNFLGGVRTMQEVLPHLRRTGGGRIVNIASLAALHGVPYLAAYGASKAALVAYSQSLRAELAPERIRVQLVYPDYTQSEIFAAETRLGGARRPRPPYAPTERVAGRVADAIEHGGDEVVLGARGRLLALLRGLLPRALDRIMRRLALRLADPEERCHA